MADLYRVTYECSRSQKDKAVNVSATSAANAVAAAKTADASFKVAVDAHVVLHSVVSGS